MEKVRLSDKFAMFSEHWTPKIIGEVNENHILLAKVRGEFVWHTHEEDEMFFVVKGKLHIKLRDQDVWLEPGELFVVPRGVEHCPVAEDEAQIMLIEPKTTKHTGDRMTEKTVTTYERI
jgi:mannose-6-phosphate isomerase-like protein (cupin superfamily)